MGSPFNLLFIKPATKSIGKQMYNESIVASFVCKVTAHETNPTTAPVILAITAAKVDFSN
jgi:hypothetical protein